VVALAPPYPNPARDEINLRFSTARRGPVRLGIYDVSGRLVRPCVQSVLDPGEYTVRADLGRVPAGIYFVRLWTPEITHHEKLVLVN
jgi:hypothetical protein